MSSPSRIFPLLLAIAITAPGQDAADPDPKRRAKAARQAVSEGSGAISRIRPLLKDPVLDVRIATVDAIVEIGTQHSLDALAEAARDNDPGIQIRAVDGIVNFYTPGYAQSGARRIAANLRARFEKENRDVIAPHLAVRPEAASAIARVVRGGSSMESRTNAARAAGILRASAATPDLIQSLKSKHDALIFESLIALQKIRDPAAGPSIIFLLRDLSEKIQLAAIETAGLLQTREAIPGLQKSFADPRGAKAKRAALSALAMMPDESNLSHYQTGLNDARDEALRVAGAEGIGRLKNAASRTTLLSLFESEQKQLARLAIAFALAHLGSLEVSPPETAQVSPLRHLLNNLNSRQRQQVAEAYLAELSRAQPVRSALHPALTGGTRDEKIGLLRVLALSGDKYSVQHMENLTKDPDQEVSVEAVRAVRDLRARL